VGGDQRNRGTSAGWLHPELLQAAPAREGKSNDRSSGNIERSFVLKARLTPDAAAVAKIGLISGIARIGDGDKAAFKQVYDATCAKLYGIIFRILGDRDSADDILQDVYLRIWQHAREFDSVRSSPITWMAAIARNRALDARKKRSRKILQEVPGLEQITADDNPQAHDAKCDNRRRLDECLRSLEPEKREVVLLAYYYGLTREEISYRTGRPAATIKTWLRRSLAQLKSDFGS
jgi:RNA polymerase sigma-70 factor, ECF subfamily